MPRKFWTVVREHRFEQELRALIRNAIRADELLKAQSLYLHAIRAKALKSRERRFGLCRWRSSARIKSRSTTRLTKQQNGCSQFAKPDNQNKIATASFALHGNE